MAVPNPIAQFAKDPAATLDYAIDWSDWLGDDQILTVLWTVPGGITQITSMFSAAITIIWLAGGTAGTSYTITCHITTARGRIDNRSIQINAVNR